jgi:hypothetical protein
MIGSIINWWSFDWSSFLNLKETGKKSHSWIADHLFPIWLLYVGIWDFHNLYMPFSNAFIRGCCLLFAVPSILLMIHFGWLIVIFHSWSYECLMGKIFECTCVRNSAEQRKFIIGSSPIIRMIIISYHVRISTIDVSLAICMMNDWNRKKEWVISHRNYNIIVKSR